MKDLKILKAVSIAFLMTVLLHLVFVLAGSPY